MGMRYVSVLQSTAPGHHCVQTYVWAVCPQAAQAGHLVTVDALRLAPVMVWWSEMPQKYIGFMETHSKFASAVIEWSCK